MCSIVSVSLLLLSAGLSSVLSLVLGVVGMVYGRRGKRNVEQDRTRKHGDLANAAWILGIVTTTLSVLATLFWAAIFVLAATDPDWLDEEQNDPFDEDYEFQTAVLVLSMAARLVC